MRVVLFLALAGSLLGCPTNGPVPAADPATLGYLERTLWTPSHGGRVGCGYETVGSDERLAETYVWAVCEEIVGGEAVGGRSGPVVLVTDEIGAVISHRAPRDGSAHGVDTERLFPPDVRAAFRDQTSTAHRRLVSRLRAEAHARATRFSWATSVPPRPRYASAPPSSRM